MGALEVLIEEHEIILKTIGVLDKSVRKLQSEGKVPPGFFEKVIDIIKNFADKCHHGKEEIVLFPLIKARGEREGRVVSLLLEDHKSGRGFVRALSEAVVKNDIEGIVNSANSYAGILYQHIKKEDAIFPVWINALSDESRKGLSEKFEEIEEEVIGLGKHHEYVQNIEALEKSL